MLYTKLGSSDLKRLLRELYTEQVASFANRTAMLWPIGPLIFYPWQIRLGRKATAYLKAGLKRVGTEVAALRARADENEIINYWKDFIRGIPEYSALVKAKKFQEIENILFTLAQQNEVLRHQEGSIRELRKAMEELRHEPR